jgi:hypothetical protein
MYMRNSPAVPEKKQGKVVAPWFAWFVVGVHGAKAITEPLIVPAPLELVPTLTWIRGEVAEYP